VKILDKGGGRPSDLPPAGGLHAQRETAVSLGGEIWTRRYHGAQALWIVV